MLWLRKIEHLLLNLGVLMSGVYFGSVVHQALFSRVAVNAFKAEYLTPYSQQEATELVAAKPNFGLWSSKRIKSYEKSLLAHFDPVIAVLRIPKIHVDAPVLEGTEESTLNRGVGRIAGTGRVGDEGNMALAGHRDGFFRGLKDVGTGDTIEVITPRRTEIYIVDRVVIVDPGDVSVLEPRSYPSLTLVTCYPFYFVGSAPKRYIVQASRSDFSGAMSGVLASSATAKNQSERQGKK